MPGIIKCILVIHLFPIREVEMSKIKRQLPRGVAAVIVACAMLLPASAAHAANYGPGGSGSFDIDMNKACAYFTSVGWATAAPLSSTDPNSWRCFVGSTQVGGLSDLSLWCQYWHSSNGAYATVTNWSSAYSWRCIVP